MSRPSPVREARLRPEFASLYPGLEPGIWHTANTLAEHMTARLLRQGKANLALHPRVLNPDHFEFRGGQSPDGGPPAAGRRLQD